jgi:hypothetical protein
MSRAAAADCPLASPPQLPGNNPATTRQSPGNCRASNGAMSQASREWSDSVRAAPMDVRAVISSCSQKRTGLGHKMSAPTDSPCPWTISGLVQSTASVWSQPVRVHEQFASVYDARTCAVLGSAAASGTNYPQTRSNLQHSTSQVMQRRSKVTDRQESSSFRGCRPNDQRTISNRDRNCS